MAAGLNPMGGVTKPAGKEFLLSGLAYADEIGSTTWTFLPADVIPKFSVSVSAQYTKTPLENGALVSDHVIHDPDQFSVTINQTNTPILAKDGFERRELTLQMPLNRFRPGGLLGLSASVANLIGALKGGDSGSSTKISILQTSATGSDLNRIDSLWGKLQDIKLRSLPLKLVVQGREYVNIFITTMDYKRENASELGIFDIQCERILFTSTEASKLKFPNPADSINSSKTDLGKKPPTAEQLEAVGLQLGVTNALLPPGF